MTSLGSNSLVYDAVIVGAGAMGSATAWQLAKQHKKTLLVEQFEFGHGKGSSHGESRIIRRTYPDDHFAVLMPDAYNLWEEAQTESGIKCMRQTGGLDFSIETSKELSSLIGACKKFGLDHEVLTPDQVQNRFPSICLPSNYKAVYQKDAGVVNARKALEMFRSLAKKHGCEMLEKTAVVEVEMGQGSNHLSKVFTKDKTYQTRKVILTLGGWAPSFLSSQFNINLPAVQVVKISYGFWEVDQAWNKQYQPENLPIFIFYNPACRHIYGFPVLEKEGHIKVALHYSHEPVTNNDLSTRTFVPDERSLNEVGGFLRKHFLGGVGTDLPVETNRDTCLYTRNEEDNFIIDTHPANPSIIIATGFSGHGFKFTPLIGRILSDLAIQGETQYDIAHFKLPLQARRSKL